MTMAFALICVAALFVVTGAYLRVRTMILNSDQDRALLEKQLQAKVIEISVLNKEIDFRKTRINHQQVVIKQLENDLETTHQIYNDLSTRNERLMTQYNEMSKHYQDIINKLKIPQEFTLIKTDTKDDEDKSEAVL